VARLEHLVLRRNIIIVICQPSICASLPGKASTGHQKRQTTKTATTVQSSNLIHQQQHPPPCRPKFKWLGVQRRDKVGIGGIITEVNLSCSHSINWSMLNVQETSNGPSVIPVGLQNFPFPFFSKVKRGTWCCKRKYSNSKRMWSSNSNIETVGMACRQAAAAAATTIRHATGLAGRIIYSSAMTSHLCDHIFTFTFSHFHIHIYVILRDSTV